MGIVNVTPDSFSDGGRFFDPAAALDHARQLVAAGADILDVGGESTRPRALPVEEPEELRRVLPVIERLVGELNIPVSIDTQKPEVARQALAAGASIVNDIAANRTESRMWEIVSQASAGYILMHMQGTPQTMQSEPRYQDLLGEVSNFFSDRLRQLELSGVPPEQVALDVGIGFGKTLTHNLELLTHHKRFTLWQRPVLLGVSRKSFLGKLLGAELHERLPAGLACAVWGVLNGANIIRTHDVRETVQALRMIEAIAR